MDDQRYNAVMEAVRAHVRSWAYNRGDRIVNWIRNYRRPFQTRRIDTSNKKTPSIISNTAVRHRQTVRPETKFGDKYVVIAPDDARYKEYAHGQKIDLEWINGPITATIIKDEAAYMEFAPAQ